MYFSPAFVLAALPLLAAAMPASHLQVNKNTIHLTRRSTDRRADGTVNVDVLKAGIKASVAKIQRGFAAYEHNTGSTHPLAKAMKARKRTTGATALADASQRLWYGQIEAGTPPTTFTVDFDTGSSDLFLPGPKCGGSCSGHTIYNPKSSSTAHDLGKHFDLTYDDGSTVSGEQYTDTVTISGLVANKQTLGAAKVYSPGFESSQFPADGLMGMAFRQISVYGANPFFQSLVSQGVVDEPVFGFKLSENDAELFLGGVDDDLVGGNFTYVPVTEEGYWQVSMDGVSVDGKAVVESVESIIDTGTTLIIGDSQSVAELYSRIGGAQDNNDGTYTVDCTSNPKLSLTFGGREFAVNASTFVINVGEDTCIGGLSYIDDISSQPWIVGDVFLQNVYSAYDVGNSQVGFANLA